MNRRGQTAYDYLLGIVLLLVAIITVLSLFPQLFGPFVDPVSSDREKMADRVASDVIEQTALNGSERTVNLDELNAMDIEAVKSQSGIPEAQSVNVTVEGTDVQIGDEQIGNGPSATVTRTVRAESQTYDCDQGCKLTVRVW